ncbi:hypothetical protein IDJ75_06260 [Mucilaginibacter rigui]|uniref:Uncharacterized protein n=1 Tax=Mucilaginibacter rigui TaxID=534635 RepID=A0ABR7X2Q5_9SPHI|nr:hypothetical protein [Mucilaginibacter rigui]MBD1384874.1 hypothetical protein [Mucilaginibacter rigui]
MWNIIKKYYLATFAGMFAATLIKILLDKHTETFYRALLIALATAFVISLIAGTLFYFQDTKWGPKKRKKLFDKSPFVDLLMNRFIQKDYAAVGVINGYTVIVSYTWPNGGAAIAVNVLFDKDFAARYNGDIDNIKNRNKLYTWTEGAVGDLLTYNYRRPSYYKIMETAEVLINVLKAEGLSATNYKDNEKPELATGNITRFGAVI